MEKKNQQAMGNHLIWVTGNVAINTVWF